VKASAKLTTDLTELASESVEAVNSTIIMDVRQVLLNRASIEGSVLQAFQELKPVLNELQMIYAKKRNEARDQQITGDLRGEVPASEEEEKGNSVQLDSRFDKKRVAKKATGDLMELGVDSGEVEEKSGIVSGEADENGGQHDAVGDDTHYHYGDPKPDCVRRVLEGIWRVSGADRPKGESGSGTGHAAASILMTALTRRVMEEAMVQRFSIHGLRHSTTSWYLYGMSLPRNAYIVRA